MCGIVGLLYRDSKVDAYDFTRMRDTLTHRGPDDAGSNYFDGRRIAFGQRRLSFLDLSSAGRQPMSNENDSVWIVFNGEIYNYVELREQLIQAGHRFKTHTDTEVIVHGYEEWGPDVVNRLTGMFAFAVLDLNGRKLFLARDRFGIKPLYYMATESHFAFASELKAIVACKDITPEPDISAVADYLIYRYVPSPKTIWLGMSKLPPAHTLSLDIDTLKWKVEEYWKLSFGETNSARPAKMVQEYGNMLARSVAIHARADVPIGSFLSGGYDSSAVVHYLTRAGYRPETFSIGFADWDNSEHQFASTVAEKLAVPHSAFLAEESTLDLLQIMPDVYDEPLADISILPTWLVSREARRKVKAVMSGEGADELLGGYWWQKKIYALTNPEPQNRSLLSKLTSLFRKPTPVEPVDRLEIYADASSMGRFDRTELESAFCPDHHTLLPADPEWFYRQNFDQNLSALKSFQRMDIKCFMGELVLTKIDRASMANSLEVRVPFLDHRAFEYVLSASEHRYYRPDVTKYLLHDNIKSHLPESIMNRPKQGFVGPDDFYKSLDRYESILKGSQLAAMGVIRQEYIDRLFEEADHWRLWKLAVLENWYSRWVCAQPAAEMPRCFVFAVCGKREYTDGLQVALRSLKRYSSANVIIVTDKRRNEAEIDWPNTVDVETPSEFDNHQASIYLKTGLHKFLPGGRIYCYLDTDVLAVDHDADSIFNNYCSPITFAPDLCRMPQFSSAAVRCNCGGPLVEEEMTTFQQLLDFLRASPPGYQWENDWPGWQYLPQDDMWITPAGNSIGTARCQHLRDHIGSKFGIVVEEDNWQHWNGGVFLFTDESHAFMEAWHQKTMAIFGDPMWRTRDQGTLIATAWEFGLSNAPTLSRSYNLIIDYNARDDNFLSEDGTSISVDRKQNFCKPCFVHVMHHFGDTKWFLWNWISQRIEG